MNPIQIISLSVDSLLNQQNNHLTTREAPATNWLAGGAHNETWIPIVPIPTIQLHPYGAYRHSAYTWTLLNIGQTTSHEKGKRDTTFKSKETLIITKDNVHDQVDHMTLLHDRALAPVGKGLLPRFPSRCCPSGTKGPPFSPGSANRG